MTKDELLQFLKPFTDDIEILIEPDRIVGKLTYKLIDGEGVVVLTPCGTWSEMLLRQKGLLEPPTSCRCGRDEDKK